MPQLGAHEPGAHRTFIKTAGEEPLPGYVLIEPLGRGGFGEVWKCEAPGGLLKAIKFVTSETAGGTDNTAQLRQEYEAFQQVKVIRHPFLLSLERVELVADELIMVMELADRQLGDRFTECRRQGLPGIPRDELLGYLREAAEALDVIGTKYGLQHLDVKPANLFLTAGHVQVGDYGLVSKSDGVKKGSQRGLTPRYAAPEVLCGEVHTNSDQYSLALVYHELLTGAFPYSGQTVQQLMLQHVTVPPDLRALPPFDRPAVGTALAKKPDERFPSCLDFVRALLSGMPNYPPGTPGTIPDNGPKTRSLTDLTEPARSIHLPPARHRADSDRRRQLVTPRPPRPPRPRTVPADTAAGDTSLADGFSVPQVRLERIYSLVPVPWLLGREAPRSTQEPLTAVETVVQVAAGGQDLSSTLGSVVRLEDGSRECRFLTTIDPRLGQVKLDLLWEEAGVLARSKEAGVIRVRKFAPLPPPSGLFAFSKKPTLPESGYELLIRLPEPGCGTGEVTINASFFGTPTAEFEQTAEKEITSLLEGARRVLNTIPERRQHPRIPAAFPLTIYPLHSDGRVELPVKGACKDVSLGGLALTTEAALPSKYFYAAFEGIPELRDLAILAQVVRAQALDKEVFISSRYRLDIAASGVCTGVNA